MNKLVIDAKRENLEQVLAFVDEALEEAGCGPKQQIQLDIAVEEIFVNIASYAYPQKTGTAELQFEVLSERNAVKITFIDSGIPYDPLAKEDPDVTLSAEERQIGGLGIYMVKKSMDEVAYEHRDGKNVFSIVKEMTA